MPERNDIDLELSHVWNELTETGRLQPISLDPETVNLLRRLKTSANAPLPESARERVWRGLLDTYELPVSDKESSMLTTTDVIRSVPNGLVRPLRLNPSIERPRQINHRVTLAIAAALIVAIIGGIAGGFLIDRLDSSDPGPGPAVVAPSIPSPEAAGTTETLFEITLPADVIPVGELGTMDISSKTIPANSVTGRTADTFSPGANVIFVLEGLVTIEGDGPIQVIRHDGAGAIEDHEAGDPADLGPGDLVVVRNEDGQTWTTGAAEVEVVLQTLLSGNSFAPPSSKDWQVHAYTYDLHSVVLPGGPYKLSLQQVRVESETSFDLPANGVNQLAIFHEGRAMVGKGTDGVIRLMGLTEPVTLFILTLSTTPEGTGTPVAGMGAADASPTP